MQWLQAIFKRTLKHKYAINSKLLGDSSKFAWSNLGYWDTATVSYPQACSQLAQRLADAVHLNSNDILLDLGCGQGASLELWKTIFHVKHIEAVELQPLCVSHIQNNINFIHKIHCESFLNLKAENFEFKFDVALCVDAAYHSDLNLFISAVSLILNSKGRVAFHYLALTEKFSHLNSFQKKKYQYLLKCADVNLKHLSTDVELKQLLNQHDFKQVQIKDLSENVLNGFSNYIYEHGTLNEKNKDLDYLKILMTAKLCKKLYEDDLIHYVQVSAVKSDKS